MSVFLEILRCILCCDEDNHHERYCDTLERDPLLQSSSNNSAVRSSSHSNNYYNNNNLPCHSEWTKIYNDEYYPNLSTSSSTTKNPSSVSQQSEYVNKLQNKTHEVSQSLKSSWPSQPSMSYNPIPSPSSPQSLSKLIPSSKPDLSFSNCKTSSSNRSLSPPKASQSLTQSSSFHKPAPASSVPIISPTQPAPSSCKPSLSSSRPEIPPPKASSSVSRSASSSLSQSLVLPQAPQSFAKAKLPASLIKPSPSLHGSVLSSSTPTPLSVRAPSISQPTLSPFLTNSTNQQKNDNYTWVEKGTSPYKIPKDVEDLIKKDIVPYVLKKPLSPSTYKDYFAALLYAEDFYIEKWSKYQLLNVKLELHEAAIYDKSLKKQSLEGRDQKSMKDSRQKEEKFFVAFAIDSIPGKRPFLLSRDFVFARRSGSEAKKFQGLLYRVVKSTTVLVEFEKDFYSQHHSNRRYDISFSFNRVCLKRAHQAIAAASDSLFKNFLFPDCVSRKSIPSSKPCLYRNNKLDLDSNSAVRQILSFEGQPPYLIEGPLSKTEIIVLEAVVKIYQCWPKNRILICAPFNRICDMLIGSLKKDIPKSDMFRANAAFREVEEVPDDILPLCLYEGECFSCPSLEGLRQYRVIFSTFVSSSRLHNKGLTAGHFSHIFLVDASSAIDPEVMIALNNFANENTTVIVTGTSYNYPRWVRSDIARKNGLKTSYFERLLNTETYRSANPAFITQLSNSREESDKTLSFLSFS